MKIESLQDLLRYLNRKESEILEYFIVKDNPDRIILLQRTNFIPSDLTIKLRDIPDFTEEPTDEKYKKIRVIQKALKPSELFLIPLDKLRSSPFQARVGFDHFALQVLAATIRSHGVIEPLLVRPLADGVFEVVAGERRFRAAGMAKASKAPCVVRHLSDKEALECALIENLQRVDLTDYEVARMLDEMTKRFEYTQEQLAEKVGKTQAWVSFHLRMLELEKSNIITRVIMEKLTEGHAREILAAPPERRPYVATQVEAYIATEGAPPSVREIHKMWHLSEPEAPAAVEEKSVEEEAEESEEDEASEEVVNLESKCLPEHQNRSESDVADVESVAAASSKNVLKSSVARQESEPLLTGFEVECPECNKKLLINHIHWPNGVDAHEIEAER